MFGRNENTDPLLSSQNSSSVVINLPAGLHQRRDLFLLKILLLEAQSDLHMEADATRSRTLTRNKMIGGFVSAIPAITLLALSLFTNYDNNENQAEQSQFNWRLFVSLFPPIAYSVTQCCPDERSSPFSFEFFKKRVNRNIATPYIKDKMLDLDIALPFLQKKKPEIYNQIKEYLGKEFNAEETVSKVIVKLEQRINDLKDRTKQPEVKEETQDEFYDKRLAEIKAVPDEKRMEFVHKLIKDHQQYQLEKDHQKLLNTKAFGLDIAGIQELKDNKPEVYTALTNTAWVSSISDNDRHEKETLYVLMDYVKENNRENHQLTRNRRM